MEFTAKDVAKLREETGAGFADCKNALTDAKTFDEAVKLIEQKGQKRAEKVKGQERETREGVGRRPTSIMAATWACCSS